MCAILADIFRSVETPCRASRQSEVFVVQLGHFYFSEALSSFPGRNIYVYTHACCTCSVRISDGRVPLVLLSEPRSCPQIIRKTTNKILSGDVTTTFPALVVSTSDLTTENVRRPGATPYAVPPFMLEYKRPWFDAIHALDATVAVAYCGANRLRSGTSPKIDSQMVTVIRLATHGTSSSFASYRRPHRVRGRLSYFKRRPTLHKG